MFTGPFTVYEKLIDKKNNKLHRHLWKKKWDTIEMHCMLRLYHTILVTVDKVPICCELRFIRFNVIIFFYRTYPNPLCICTIKHRLTPSFLSTFEKQKSNSQVTRDRTTNVHKAENAFRLDYYYFRWNRTLFTLLRNGLVRGISHVYAWSDHHLNVTFDWTNTISVVNDSSKGKWFTCKS